jgi:hypothetical protein
MTVGMSAYFVAIAANEFDAKPAGSLDHTVCVAKLGYR